MNQRRVTWLLISIVILLVATIIVSIWLFPQYTESFRNMVLLVVAAFVGVITLVATILAILESKLMTKGKLRVVPSDFFLFNPSRKGLTSHGSFIGVVLTITDSNPDKFIFYDFLGNLKQAETGRIFLLQPFLMKVMNINEDMEIENFPARLKKLKRFSPLWVKNEDPLKVLLLFRFGISSEIMQTGNFVFSLHTIVSQKYQPVLNKQYLHGQYYIGQTEFTLTNIKKLPRMILLDDAFWFRNGKLIK
jgi:hypothetical protein